jgi:hypothetical protein
MIVRNEATGLIVLLDGVDLLHMQEGQTWHERL